MGSSETAARYFLPPATHPRHLNVLTPRVELHQRAAPAIEVSGSGESLKLTVMTVGKWPGHSGLRKSTLLQDATIWRPRT